LAATDRRFKTTFAADPLSATAAPKADILSFPKKPAAELPCYSSVINSLGFSLRGENCNETDCLFDCGFRLNIRGRLRDYASHTHRAASARGREQRQRC
jgi:hypothetical protein